MSWITILIAVLVAIVVVVIAALLITVLNSDEDYTADLIGPPPCICDHSDDKFDCDGQCLNKPDLGEIKCNCERGLKECDFNCGVTGNMTEIFNKNRD